MPDDLDTLDPLPVLLIEVDVLDEQEATLPRSGSTARGGTKRAGAPIRSPATRKDENLIGEYLLEARLARLGFRPDELGTFPFLSHASEHSVHLYSD